MHYVSEDDLELLIFCVHLVGVQLLRCMLPKHSINRTSAQHLEVFFLLSSLFCASGCLLHPLLLWNLSAYCMSTWYSGRLERASDPLELEFRQLKATMWVLRVKPRSSGKADRAFNLQRLSHPFKHLIIFFFDTESRLALAGLENTVDQGGLRLDAILLPQLPVLRLQAVPPHLTNNFAFQGKYNGRSSAPSESSSAYLIVLRQQWPRAR